MFHAAVVALSLLAQSKEVTPIPGVGPVNGEIKKLHSGFRFTEGPAADADGVLYFTDVPQNRIHRVGADGQLSTFLEETQACNGLMFAPSGRLIACQGGAHRIVAIDPATKEIVAVVEQFNDKPFIRPNDVAVDSTGGVYFTDPKIGREPSTQDKMGVYYVPTNADGSYGPAFRLIDDVAIPNGVLLSPDEKTLYVLPSGKPELMAYEIENPGKIGAGRVFCPVEATASGFPRGGDGLTCDREGRLYLTAPSVVSLQVVAPDGKTLGLIRMPERPSNCCFGGPDGKTLFVTATSSLYALPMEVEGHWVARKK